jgi:L-ribulose-5-phosphate 4-epimerase
VSTGEGVIKFRLEHQPAPPLPAAQIEELNRWRAWMQIRGLLGQMETRNGPLGFGNISCRVAGGFIITGSQTGGLAEPGPEHFTLVREVDLERNLVYSEGPIEPSSESLTHAAVYAQEGSIRWVMHGHCASIWVQAEVLALPTTLPDVPYGTPQMAAEVARLFREENAAVAGIFAMGGHRDGIVSAGKTAEEAAAAIKRLLSKLG